MWIRSTYIVIDNHVRIYDADGSYAELTPEDALELAEWITARKEVLQDIIRRKQRAAEKGQNNETTDRETP